MSHERIDYRIKVAIIGDPGTGKSSILKAIEDKDKAFSENARNDLIQRFSGLYVHLKTSHTVNGEFIPLPSDKDSLYKQTVEFTWVSELISAYGGHQNKIDAVCGAADIVIITYDVTDTQTFNNVANWKAEAEKWCSPTAHFILVGTKTDQTIRRYVTEEPAKKAADDLKMTYVEVSAKNNPKSIQTLISTTLVEAGKKLNEEKKLEFKSSIPAEQDMIDLVRASQSLINRNQLVRDWVNSGKRLKDPQWKNIRDYSLEMLLDEVKKLSPIEKDARLRDALTWPLFNVHRNTGIRAFGRTDTIVKITKEINANAKDLNKALKKDKEEKAIADAIKKVR